MIDILALSHASLTDVNRAIYARLAQRGWDIQIVIPTSLTVPTGVKQADPQRPGDPPLHLRPLANRQNLRRAQFVGIEQLLNELRPRLIFVDNDPASKMAFDAGRWARQNSAKVAAQSCENIPRSPLADLKRGKLIKSAKSIAINLMMRRCSRFVDHVFAISDDGVVLWENSSMRGRVSKIPLGFDPDIFHPNPALRDQTRAKLQLSHLTIAYFGRINRQKGVHLLIEALSRLKDRNWQFLLDHFAAAGDSYLEEISSQIDRLGLRDRLVQFEAKHSEMGAFMNAADIVVVPSLTVPGWKEQYGRVAPEAMACGKLVMVSNCGALPELVGDAGAVFPEKNVEAIADLLQRSLDDASWRETLGAAAAARASTHLSLQRQCDLMHAQFIQLLGSGPSR